MQPCFIVDAFVDQIFSGNPAAVVLLKQEADASWMQKVAAEFNLSETSFLVPRAEGEWGLRWFTPTKEVNLCGHATLAAAHVLANELKLGLHTYVFHSHSGALMAVKEGDQLVLNFPRTPTSPASDQQNINQLLALDNFPVFNAGDDLLIEFPSTQAVESYVPNLAAIAGLECRGLIATAVANAGDGDFVSRFFAPAYGIPEDPVTGSAHCALADYWSRRLSKTVFIAKQLSARRGFLTVELQAERVFLKGRCNTMVRGELDAGREF